MLPDFLIKNLPPSQKKIGNRCLNVGASENQYMDNDVLLMMVAEVLYT
jgi:hypothetical protein